MKQELVTVSEFRIQELLVIGLLFVVLGITVAYGLDVMEDVQGDMTANGAGYNATRDAITGVAKIPSKMPLIATVVIASVIIGILVTYFIVRFKG